MKKLTFDQVLAEDRRIFSTIKSNSDIASAMEEFFDFLKEAGWTSEEYDSELCKVVDVDWDGGDKWHSN
jgi:hypothetical protein